MVQVEQLGRYTVYRIGLSKKEGGGFVFQLYDNSDGNSVCEPEGQLEDAMCCAVHLNRTNGICCQEKKDE